MSTIQEVIQKVKRFNRTGLQESEKLARENAFLFRDEVRNLAPVETGYYRSTIEVHEQELVGFVRSGFYISVATDHPAAMRLEFGYIGLDSLGRAYHQAPIPHWRPAAEIMRAKISKDLQAVLPAWWR